MSDPAKQDKPRPPAGATDPAFKASAPPPRPAGGAPKAGPGPSKPGEPAGDAKPDAFKVIRTAPAPESDGPGAGPIIAVLVLIVLGVGGFMYTRRSGTTPTTTGSPTTGSPNATTGPVAKPAPDFVIQAIVDAETVANAQRALDKALEYRKEYPGAPNLEAKIAELRGRLGQGGASDASAKLGQAQRALSEQRFDDAVSLAEAVIADSPSPQLLGQAYFISAQANIGKRDLTKAESDLQAAEEAGFDKGPLDQLRGMIRR